MTASLLIVMLLANISKSLAAVVTEIKSIRRELKVHHYRDGGRVISEDTLADRVESIRQRVWRE